MTKNPDQNIPPYRGGWTFWTLVVKLKSQKTMFWTFWTYAYTGFRTAAGPWGHSGLFFPMLARVGWQVQSVI